MLNYEAITTKRADEIIPGDVFDTRCGVADLAWKTVLRVRVIERAAPNQDRIEITLDTDSLGCTREMVASSTARVIPADRA